MYTCQALGSWSMLYATRHQVYWGLTCGFLLVLWFNITDTQTHTYTKTHSTLGPAYWHTHINIYLHQLLCAHSSYLVITLNEELTEIKNLLSTRFFFISKMIHLQKSYLLIRCYKARFFLWKTNNTDRNGVNKQNTYTPNTQRNIIHWKGLAGMKIGDTPPFLPPPPSPFPILFYQPFPFYGKNLNLHFFKNFKNCEKSKPLFIKGSGVGRGEVQLCQWSVFVNQKRDLFF